MIRHLLRTALTLACLAEAELLTRRARLVRRVDELERRLAAALATIEREAVGVDVDDEPLTEFEISALRAQARICEFSGTTLSVTTASGIRKLLARAGVE